MALLTADDVYNKKFTPTKRRSEGYDQDEVDEFLDGHAWRSVIAYGRYEELPDRVGSKVQRERAWTLLSREAEWWAPGGFKPVAQAPAPHLFYRIVIDEVTGRHAFPEKDA